MLALSLRQKIVEVESLIVVHLISESLLFFEELTLTDLLIDPVLLL